MDVTATTVATALAGILAPTITQLTKKYIPDEWRKTFAITVSIITAIIALAATNGFNTRNWGVLIVAVVGIAQTLYTVYDGAKTIATSPAGE